MKLFNIENLTQDEVNLILTSLSELPYRLTFELIHKIQIQGEEQLQEQVSNE